MILYKDYLSRADKGRLTKTVPTGHTQPSEYHLCNTRNQMNTVNTWHHTNGL